MNTFNKVLWGEGLFLRPQHFQQQDHYHESHLSDVARTLHPYYWGVRKIKFDLDALANGQMRLNEISIIFPDGESYNAPGADPLPDALNLTSIPNLADGSIIYLAIAPLKEFAQNSVEENSMDSGQVVRYSHSHTSQSDLFTQGVPADITLLKRWVRLIPEHESRDQFVTLPIGRIRRSATGAFEVDGAFMPPASSIQATPAQTLMLRRLLDILEAKVSALYGHHREPSKNIIEFRSGDIASFWLLHTASHHYGQILHLYQNPAFHPERLFQTLLSLAGALMTFSNVYSLTDLPTYRHDEPTPAFLRLYQIIRELLETVISTRYFAIAISEFKPSFWKGQLDSDKIDSQTTFFLAVASSIPAPELVETVPIYFKLGAPDDVEKFVLSAMPGVKLTYAPQVPAAVPVRPGHYYFALDNKGPIYERMLKAQSISIYVPNNFPDLKLEMIAVAS